MDNGSSREAAAAAGVGVASPVTGGRKYALSITDTPYHAYGPEDSQLACVRACREVAERCERRRGRQTVGLNDGETPGWYPYIRGVFVIGCSVVSVPCYCHHCGRSWFALRGSATVLNLR